MDLRAYGCCMTDGDGVVDDPDRGLSSDDMLRAALHEVAIRPSSSEEVSGEQRPAPGEGNEPMPIAAAAKHTDDGQTVMVTSCVIRRVGSLWQKVVGKEYRLLIDSQVYARISTRAERDSKFAGAESIRRTTVDIARNQSKWHIQPLEPGRRERPGHRYSINDRVITVSENLQPIASSEGPISTSKKETFVAMADGRRFAMSPPGKARQGIIAPAGPGRDLRADAATYRVPRPLLDRAMLGRSRAMLARSKEHGTGATLQRDGVSPYSAWSLNTSSPIPLSIVLLYWHVLLGDHTTSDHGYTIG
jgi:hypothetical protein